MTLSLFQKECDCAGYNGSNQKNATEQQPGQRTHVGVRVGLLINDMRIGEDHDHRDQKNDCQDAHGVVLKRKTPDPKAEGSFSG
jgi:hypothetical protein